MYFSRVGFLFWCVCFRVVWMCLVIVSMLLLFICLLGKLVFIVFFVRVGVLYWMCCGIEIVYWLLLIMKSIGNC